MTYTEIDIDSYDGLIPEGTDLVVMEKGQIESSLILYGFDEVGVFDSDFTTPVYAFITLEK